MTAQADARPPASADRAFDVAGRSHRGKVRERNEDAWLAVPEIGLFAVIDGMGGARAGARAAALTREVLADQLPRTAADLRQAFEAAHGALRDHATNHPEDSGLGCVATTALLRGARLTLAHVGDTRAYLATKAGCQQLTRDHTVVAEIQERHAMTEADAGALPGKHRITRDLGSGARQPGSAWVDLVEGVIDVGDVLLLTSDGLTDLVDDGEIARLLGRARDETESSVERVAERFIELALERGAHDNITVVVVRRLETRGFDDTETITLPVPVRRERRVQVAPDADGSRTASARLWFAGVATGLAIGFGAALLGPWGVNRPDPVVLVKGSSPAATIDADRLAGRFSSSAALTALGPLAIVLPDLETEIAERTRIEFRGLDLRFLVSPATWTLKVAPGADLVLRQTSIRAPGLQLHLELGAGARVQLRDCHLAIAGLRATGDDSTIVRGGGQLHFATPMTLEGPDWIDEDLPPGVGPGEVREPRPGAPEPETAAPGDSAPGDAEPSVDPEGS